MSGRTPPRRYDQSAANEKHRTCRQIPLIARRRRVSRRLTACRGPTYHRVMTCERCQLETAAPHESQGDCVLALRHEVCALRLRLVALEKADAEHAGEKTPSS